MFQSLEFLIDQRVNIEEIVKTLVAFGFIRATKVFKEGEFAVRGGVIDVYPDNFEVPVRLDIDDDVIVKISGFDPFTGQPVEAHRIVVILPFKKSSLPFSSDTPLNNFVDISKGDYVVHNNHGIGRLIGIRPLEADPQRREHLIIEYKDGDKLFVPKHDIHLVQKYVSFTKKPARLHKLGSKEWVATRKAIEKKLRLLAAELLRTQALRAQLVGFAFSKDTQWQKEFEAKFPFKETPDQIKSAAEVKADMEDGRPMDRLICGDVGYGKTEVALRAAFKAVMDHKQVAILVPTTILAEQHYYNFQKRLGDFPVKVGMLSRFRTKNEQKAIIADLKEGKVDIVIGTHRLLSKDIAFKDLGLVIIDEEQRFGVRSKEKLKQFRLLSDVLTLSATPIPRTLYMALSGARDMSVITTPPTNRMAVKTEIIPYSEDVIAEAIDRELKRKGQVFFLHNRVDNIETMADSIRQLVPNARVAVGHGQMSPRVLEQIMLKFLKHEVDILVCTTIVESGIDVPAANTLIVNRADKFGLSDLHQLRGRVGRLDIQAYAYLVVPPKYALSDVSKQRLRAIEKFSDLGSGFHIAFEDLQIRGAGNLLGTQQHGFIASIGFDLYCRLLKESVEHLKKELEQNTNEKNPVSGR
jgi:transcription-repair coupling factor (superfamily II helicase)